MARFFVDLRTDYPRIDINHVDFTLININDSRFNSSNVFSVIPEGDLTRGVRIASFNNLVERRNYRFVARLFLNNSPYFIVREGAFTTGTRTCSGYFLWRRCTEWTFVHTALFTR